MLVKLDESSCISLRLPWEFYIFPRFFNEVHACKCFFFHFSKVNSPKFILVLLPLRCKSHQHLPSPRKQKDVLKCFCSFVFCNTGIFSKMIDLFIMCLLLEPQDHHTSSLCRKWMYSKNVRQHQHTTCYKKKVRAFLENSCILANEGYKKKWDTQKTCPFCNWLWFSEFLKLAIN